MSIPRRAVMAHFLTPVPQPFSKAVAEVWAKPESSGRRDGVPGLRRTDSATVRGGFPSVIRQAVSSLPRLRGKSGGRRARSTKVCAGFRSHWSERVGEPGPGPAPGTGGGVGRGRRPDSNGARLVRPRAGSAAARAFPPNVLSGRSAGDDRRRDRIPRRGFEVESRDPRSVRSYIDAASCRGAGNGTLMPFSPGGPHAGPPKNRWVETGTPTKTTTCGGGSFLSTIWGCE